MPEEITIRAAEPTDAPTLCAITARAFGDVSVDAAIERRYGLLNGTDWRARKAAVVSRELQDHPAGCFVALCGEEIVGYITTAADPDSSVGRILNLAVAPEKHGRGIGKALLRRGFQCFREFGLRHYRIETTTNNEAGQALYPRCGFHEVARQIMYVMSADEAADWTY